MSFIQSLEHEFYKLRSITINGLTIDVSPLAGSANPVQSGGVYSAIAAAVSNRSEVGHQHTLFDVEGLADHLSNIAAVASNGHIREVVGLMFAEAGGTYDSVTQTITFPTSTVSTASVEAASLTSAFAATFKSEPHEAPLGLVPTFFDWAVTGRQYATDYINTNRTTHKHMVQWMHAFANGNNVWPTDLGVEVGVQEVWAKVIATGQWTLIRSWPTLNAYQHNRDDHGYNNGNGVAENFGTAPTGLETKKLSSSGTWIVRRANNATFPEKGTNIHGYFLESNASSRPYFDRTLYSKVAIRGKYRVVGWPASDGLAPIVNPAGNNSGDKIVASTGTDCYLDALGSYSSSYGGDLGIGRYVLLKNDWRWLHWYTCTSADFVADPPPYIRG